MEVSGLDAVILCGGLGRRLEPVVSDRQKTMADISGKPFLQILVDELLSFGMRRFIFLTGHKAEWVEGHFKKIKVRGALFLFSRENEPLGTAGAVKNASGLIESRAFLLLNGDSYCKTDYTALLRYHHENSSDVSLVVVPAGERKDGGYIKLNDNGRIVSFDEKHYDATAYLNAGVYIFERKMLPQITELKPASLEEDVFPQLTQRRFFGFRAAGPVHDIGTPDRLDEFRKRHER